VLLRWRQPVRLSARLSFRSGFVYPGFAEFTLILVDGQHVQCSLRCNVFIRQNGGASQKTLDCSSLPPLT
jgi:hypothetical protein